MYSYKFNTETDEFPTGGTRTNGDTSDGFITFSDHPIVDWTKQKRVSGKIIDIPIIPPDPVVPLTPEEIKQQKLQQLDWEYQSQLLENTRAWASSDMEGDTETMAELVAERAELKSEYVKKRGEIENG